MLSILSQKLCSLAGLHAVHDLGKTFLTDGRRSFSTHSKRRLFFSFVFIFPPSGLDIFRKLCRQAPNATHHPQDMENSMSRKPLRWVTFQVWEDGECLLGARVDAQVGILPTWEENPCVVPYGIYPTVFCHAILQ